MTKKLTPFNAYELVPNNELQNCKFEELQIVTKNIGGKDWTYLLTQDNKAITVVDAGYSISMLRSAFERVVKSFGANAN